MEAVFTVHAAWTDTTIRGRTKECQLLGQKAVGTYNSGLGIWLHSTLISWFRGV